MIKVSEIYDDVTIDSVNAAENGDLGYEKFNRLSKRAELRMLDFLSGDINNTEAPLPYISQKDKDWLSIYIKSSPSQAKSGSILKPDDYYGYENMFLLGNYMNASDCEEDENVKEGCNTVIELLSGAQFTKRCQTSIKGKEPSFIKPIAKEVGNAFIFAPYDIGSVTLEYVAYPKYATIVSKHDDVYNQPVIDQDASTNYQYPEFARELLVYFISEFYNVGSRENALREQLITTGKLVRDERK